MKIILFLLCILLIAGTILFCIPSGLPHVSSVLGAVDHTTLDFPADFSWINTPEPLSFQHQLKGQVVLLDFWTYGCINCIHLIPTLDQLGHHFAGKPFVIIGVHSAKFANESSAQNVREAVLRYGINHPVIVDQDMQIWNMFNVNAWPTLILIGADGSIVASLPGEVSYDSLEKLVSQTLAQDHAAGSLASHPLVLPAQAPLSFAGGLFFPGKVLADQAGQRLFIADTGHNRIVVCSWPDRAGMAKLLAVYGDSIAGNRDGTAAEAEFDAPQGMALSPDGTILYVADTRNHLIRAIDLMKQTVTTILGTGQEVYDTTGGNAGTAQGINSPWDLAIDANNLYIAMAGEHQIWRMDLQNRQAVPIAGSGEEDLADGQGISTALAQPSGLALDGNILYFADSENSAIRGVNLQTGEVFTIVGHGLFDFGDTDGPAQSALLQHDLGVAVWNGNLLVADTYNHKLRLINLGDNQVTTFAGSGNPGTGTSGSPVQFYEPGGLSVAGNTIFVADTDNQRIVMIDATTGQWHEVAISGLSSPPAIEHGVTQTTISVPVQAVQATVNPDEPLTVTANVRLPFGTDLTPGVPISLRLTDEKGNLIGQQTISSDGQLPLHFVLNLQSPGFSGMSEQWTLAIYYVYCTSGNAGMCVPAQAAWHLNVELKTSGLGTEIHLPAPEN